MQVSTFYTLQVNTCSGPVTRRVDWLPLQSRDEDAWWFKQSALLRIYSALQPRIYLFTCISVSHTPKINWGDGGLHHEGQTSTDIWIFNFLKMKSVFLRGKSMATFVLNKGVSAVSVVLVNPPNHAWAQCLLYASPTWNRLGRVKTPVYFNPSTVEQHVGTSLYFT